MNRTFAPGFKGTSRILLFAAFGAAIPGISSAGVLTTEQMITEVMMAAQGADATTLGAAVGPDSATTLSFTSNVDLATENFSYALAAGTKYQGKDLAISGAGIFNSGTGQWVLSSTTTFNGTTWDDPGTAYYVDDPMFLDKTATIFGHTFRIQISEDFSAVGGVLVSTGHLDLTIDTKVIRVSIDDKKDAAGNWQWDPGSISVAAGDFKVHAAGQTPPGGGVGQFDVQIAAVPEPSSLALVAAGGVLLVCLKQRLTRRARE